MWPAENIVQSMWLTQFCQFPTPALDTTYYKMEETNTQISAFEIDRDHLMIMISSFLPFCHAIQIQRIQTHLGVGPCFRVFQLSLASNFFNLLLVGFHQARIIIVKHLIQRPNNEAEVGVEP